MNCEVVFFPNKANEQKIIDFINEAKKELKVCVFTFTNQNIAMAILNKVIKDNVKVRIITDDEQNAGVYSIVNVLQSASDDQIKFRTDLRKDAHMHHKYVVIDDKLLATGSFNWTQAAVMKNNENLLLIRDERLAKEYSANFEELWEEFKATELSISQISATHKQKALALKSKTEQAEKKALAGPKTNNRRWGKNAKQAQQPTGIEIEPKEENEEEQEEKPKRSKRPAAAAAANKTAEDTSADKANEIKSEEEEEHIQNTEEKKTNDSDSADNEPQQQIEKAKKIKRIRKLQKRLERQRQICKIKAQQKKSRTIKSLVTNAISFTLGAAISLGSFFCFTENCLSLLQ